MKYFDPARVREADAIAFQRYGMPGVLLMENAGRSVAGEIVSAFPQCRSVCVLCGPGNNGGDGFVVARHLAVRRMDVRVLVACPVEKYRGDSRYHGNILSGMGIPLEESEHLGDGDVETLISHSDVCVDSLLGTGAMGEPRGEISRLITFSLNARRVVSVDIPSGIDPTTGNVFTPCVRADLTVTLLAAKSGLAVLPARKAAGRIVVGTIGIGEKHILDTEPTILDVGEEIFRSRFPETGFSCHKYKKGVLLVVAGSEEYSGAPILCVHGALRSGVGVVHLISTEGAVSACISRFPEAICRSVPPDVDEFRLLEEHVASSTALVCGPGIGRKDSGRAWTEASWRQRGLPVVFDGDALFWLSSGGMVSERRPDVLLTPHEGEAARLLNTTADKIRSDRIGAARKISKLYGPVLLKGWTTVVDDGKRAAVICGGSPALSVAGSGDVLSGCAGSMLAFGMAPYEAGCASAWIHGKSGAKWEERFGTIGMLAGEIAEEFPGVIAGIRGKNDNASSSNRLG